MKIIFPVETKTEFGLLNIGDAFSYPGESSGHIWIKTDDFAAIVWDSESLSWNTITYFEGELNMVVIRREAELTIR